MKSSRIHLLISNYSNNTCKHSFKTNSWCKLFKPWTKINWTWNLRI